MLIPNGFDVVFIASLCVALLGLGFLLLFVENRSPAVRSAAGVTRLQVPQLWRIPRFKYLVAAAAALGLATISDAFLYLTLQHRLTFTATFIPLLYVATSLVYFLLALPMGRLADLFGRGRVFLCGYALLVGVYLIVLLPTLGAVALIACIGLFGAYYAATDGVLMAFASGMLPGELRTSGLAALTAATGLGSLAASVVFGALWALAGPESAVSVFLVALLLAVSVTLLTLWKTRGSTARTEALA
jgi:MFS family permease